MNLFGSPILREEGLLVDTGCPLNITGLSFVVRQNEAARQYGYEVQWTKLPREATHGGIGGIAPSSTEEALIPCVLEDGQLVTFAANVIPANDNGASQTPAIF